MLCLKIQCFKNEDLLIPRADRLFVQYLKHFELPMCLSDLPIQRLPQHEIQSAHESLATMNRYSKSHKMGP